jgi:hypothetical protein
LYTTFKGGNNENSQKDKRIRENNFGMLLVDMGGVSEQYGFSSSR